MLVSNPWRNEVLRHFTEGISPNRAAELSGRAANSSRRANGILKLCKELL
jgi:hypothetical protein